MVCQTPIKRCNLRHNGNLYRSAIAEDVATVAAHCAQLFTSWYLRQQDVLLVSVPLSDLSICKRAIARRLRYFGAVFRRVILLRNVLCVETVLFLMSGGLVFFLLHVFLVPKDRAGWESNLTLLLSGPQKLS